jgi:hypothetical protein
MRTSATELERFAYIAEEKIGETGHFPQKTGLGLEAFRGVVWPFNWEQLKF